MYPFFIKIPYRLNFVFDLFASISHKPWSMLLHSGYSNHPDGRFDILVTAPKITLITKDGITTIKNQKQYKTSNINPFKLLQEQINCANLKKMQTNTELPFQGGFLGIFGYDLVRYLEKIPVKAKQEIQLPDLAIGLYRWTIIADHHLCKITLISHDDPTNILSWINNYQSIKKNRSFRLQKTWRTNMNRMEYKKKFQTIQNFLQNGDCYQVCLAQRFCAPYIGDEWAAFHYLLHYNSSPFSAFIRLKKQAIMCFSPERFISLRNKNIQTKPIKGTISRNVNNFIDQQQLTKLMKSNKNKSENLMIVDLLRSDIGRIAVPGSIKVPKLFSIESFPAVHHMVSTITGTLSDNRSVIDIFKSCFPGGSVTGAPKIRAMEIIEMLEPQRRNAWCGSIAYLSCCGNMDSNIIIRTIIADQQHLFCSAGSAITINSNEDSEYQEMIDKISTIIPYLKN
ncbi:aminodeoxychorismate synthase component I [Blochmannia endosymbiont of Colobopsis nipponica]|uniref:aminodeoxychorismate synthase component I n=1 Tax=Blochmannia endosymbiont of Colobopsis nipponica TaxID=2681987 RepID=UPI0017853801|nr:aminodeoxychorismate synthase component I [Blochmannia endosymbiont of Colobopsis nipponica]QOI11015.1 aminodeoxychorismate synthase component I [Blochmannia endosymbiont of Colobopsis nipponica]